MSAASEIRVETFANGLTLIAERMPHVRSAAFNLILPAGAAYDPADKRGLAGVLSDLMVRGAGSLDHRQLTLALDRLGLDRSQGVGPLLMHFNGATLGRHLLSALRVYADILRRPHLPAHELEPVRSLALQHLQSLEDDPQSKVLAELKKRHVPAPLGYHPGGTAEGLRAIAIEDVRRQYQTYVHPGAMILAVAGDVDWPALVDTVGALFADWSAGATPPLTLGSRGERQAHLAKETQQTHFGLAYPAVPIGHPDYYAALGAVNVLSGGMSARLFTEVREKRGLCYAVWASYQTFREQGHVFCYAGTTAERAQETLEVVLQVIRSLAQGVQRDEVERVQAGLKASLIMQQEATGARASRLASDWYFLGRIRTFEEIHKAIDELTPDTITDYVRRYPPDDITLVTLGPKPLQWSASL